MRCVVRPDPGRADLLERIAQSSVDERVAWLATMREAGIRSAWQQVDRAGLSDPLQIAEFLLRRLYPNLPEASLAALLAKLRSEHEAGAWSGFARPEG
jgi:hypothetical protein